MFATAQCRNVPEGASGSSQTSAKLRVSRGAPDHCRGGERFSPSPLYFLGIVLPAAKAGLLSWNIIVSPVIDLQRRTLRHVPNSTCRPHVPPVRACTRLRCSTLSYVLELPELPSDVQRAFKIALEASFALSIKNPGPGLRSGRDCAMSRRLSSPSGYRRNSATAASSATTSACSTIPVPTSWSARDWIGSAL